MTKKLYIIDGANYLYRAFYAIRPLSNSKGLPTNALYGFTQMLLSVTRQAQPDYVVVAFDRKEPTFRDEMYSEYKANRKEPPEDLVPQFPYVQKIVEALNIPGISLAGFEADDIMGTLAQLASPDLKVVLLSGDKDLMQLINDHVSILDTMKERFIHREEVIEKFGVPPEQVIEVLALMGDSSDNVPGVKGVGPKTASQLIQQFGSVAGVYENISQVKGAVQQKLMTDRANAELSRQLVTIKCDVPLSSGLHDWTVREPHREKLRELFTELEFHKLLQELVPKNEQEQQIQTQDTQYQLVTDELAWQKVFHELKQKKRFALDTETTSLDAMQAKLVGISLATAAGKAWYVPLAHQLELGQSQPPMPQVLRDLQSLLADESVEVFGQNLKYDLKILANAGVTCQAKLFDTLLASYLVNASGQHNLTVLAQQYLAHTMIAYADVVGRGKTEITFDEVPLDKALQYSAEDADMTFQLGQIFQQKIREQGLEDLFYQLEIPLLQVLLEMEMHGVLLDCDYLQTLSKQFHEKLVQLERSIYEMAGQEFNIQSPKQLGEILFEKLQLPGGKKTKTGFSTSQDVLEDLADQHPLPKVILEYRSFAKLCSTYVDSLPQLVHPKTKRIHSSFNQVVAATGRLSSSDPNLQNIPIRSEEGRKIRSAFVAAKGFVFLDCDYSQIELRVLAHMSEDAVLLDAFAKNLDIHAITAAGIFGGSPESVSKEQRSVGKTINFATLYGQGAFSLAKQLGVSVAEAKSYIESYFARFPSIAAYREKVLDEARKTQVVKTLFGRVRPVADINAPNVMMRQGAERVAFNSVFQGTAADIIKKAMVQLHAELPKISAQSKMLMQVHDELIFEVPEAEVEKVKAEVLRIMSTCVQLKVPLLVEAGIGKNWGEAH